MGEYNRLTKDKPFEELDLKDEWGYSHIYKRLQELENKIENGTLIELPCKVGDTVYALREDSFAGYEYFELSDFLKPLNELMQKYKITAIPSFTNELATLTVINCENPEEKYSITSPFSSASLKGCHEVQNVGAVETYQRRYLYQALFDIAENDSLDAMQGAGPNIAGRDKKQSADDKPSKAPKTDKKDLPFPDSGINEKSRLRTK